MPDKSTNTRQFTRELVIKAPKEAVWRALSDAIELTQWFSPQATINGPAGGKVEWKWTDHIAWPQTIQSWEEGKRLLTAYDSPVDDGAGGKVPLFMDFQLESNKDGSATTLRLIHSGFGPEADFDNEYDGISHGWVIELRSLQLYLEKHLGRKRQLSWVQADFDMDADAAWKILTGPRGLNCVDAINGLQRGDHFTFTTAAGDIFEGEVFENDVRSFVGIAHNWDHSFLRLQVETCGGAEQVWLWHAAYGQDQQKVDGLTQRWQIMARQLFGEKALSQTNPLLEKARA